MHYPQLPRGVKSEGLDECCICMYWSYRNKLISNQLIIISLLLCCEDQGKKPCGHVGSLERVLLW
jgi:hypothetical protein